VPLEQHVDDHVLIVDDDYRHDHLDPDEQQLIVVLLDHPDHHHLDSHHDLDCNDHERLGYV
jgi:hypothetical protein